jgi:hypothetical protein
MREAIFIFILLVIVTIYLSTNTFLTFLKVNWDKKQCDYLYLANLVHNDKKSYNKSLKICVSQYRKKKGYDGYYRGLNNRMKYLVDYLRKQTERYNNIFYSKLNTRLDKSMNKVSTKVKNIENLQNIYIKQKEQYNRRLKKKDDLLNDVYLNTHNYESDRSKVDKYKTKEYISYITNA